jgi:hypothetical protein
MFNLVRFEGYFSGNTNYKYYVVQISEVIFYLDDEKKSCIVVTTEDFFEKV